MYYDFNGHECDAYTFTGSPISVKELDGFTTHAEAIQYAYQQAKKVGSPILIYSDEHTTINSSAMFDKIASYADFSKSILVNLGDDTLNVSYAEANAKSINHLNARVNALKSIPSARQMHLLGNHDVWWTNQSGSTYGAIPYTDSNKWILEKYYPNTGCSVIYGNDVVYYDSQNHIKYVTISGWDFDTSLGGYSHYAMNCEHLDAIIAELSKKDGYNIVILSHCPTFTDFDSKRLPPTDGNVDGVGSWGYDSVVNRYDTTLDAFLKARNDHTSGTVNDSYKVAHSYNFMGTSGKILCCLSGHEHIDAYGFRHGIPQIIFDSMHYDKHPIYWVTIGESKINVWKVDDSPHVYEYEVTA